MSKLIQFFLWFSIIRSITVRIICNTNVVIFCKLSSTAAPYDEIFDIPLLCLMTVAILTLKFDLSLTDFFSIEDTWREKCMIIYRRWKVFRWTSTRRFRDKCWQWTFIINHQLMIKGKVFCHYVYRTYFLLDLGIIHSMFCCRLSGCHQRP